MKQHFQKGTLKTIKENIELEKKQNYINANKLILNSSLALIHQCRKSPKIFAFSQSQSQVKLKVVYNHQK